MIRALVAKPSVSSLDSRIDQSNRGVIDLVAEWAEALGFDVRIDALPGSSGKCNLVATLGSGSDGLVLSGHTDTVPYDASRWTEDPFVLSEREGKLFGLGTADMKGFFAAALHAIGRFEPRHLRRPITLVATADEESTMAGARRLAERGESLGAFAIIGEPTDLRPIRKHKGILFVRLIVDGKSGHASQPDLGINAIEGLQRAIVALERWREGASARFVDDDFEVPTPTLSFGRVEGGDSFNRICAHCELSIDMRLLPEMDHETVLRELGDAVGDALVERPWRFEIQPAGVHVEPFSTPTDTPFVQQVEDMCGCSAGSVLFATEAPYLAKLGLETLVLGAGDIKVAHQPDEYVTMPAIRRATDLYANLIQRICVEAS